jgi:formylglycine-generating enzyme required for sulfatase activity
MPGKVNFYSMDGKEVSEIFSIQGGASVERSVPPGKYHIEIEYANDFEKPDDIEVNGFPDPRLTSFIPEKTVVNFTYRPGEVRVRSASAGILKVTGEADTQISADTYHSLTLPSGEYTLTMEYRDRYKEERKIKVSNNGSLEPVIFNYRLPETPRGFVFIPSGTFVMGSPASESQRFDNESQRRVTISKEFYMASRPVTQSEYQAVMGYNPSHFNGTNLPVEMVAWLDAIKYCNARSEREGLRQAYTTAGSRVTLNEGANGYRLPTEAEWEYACRAETTWPFYAGNSISTSQANYNDSRKHTTEAGSFPANKWGLYDMAGNVWEWCWDWYAPYTGDAADPLGPASGSRRVVRGGGFDDILAKLRSANRGSDEPVKTLNNVGFRVVRAYESPSR